MDRNELHNRGVALRKQIFGAEAVEKRMNALGDFGAPLQELINTYGYGDVWSRARASSARCAASSFSA